MTTATASGALFSVSFTELLSTATQCEKNKYTGGERPPRGIEGVGIRNELQWFPVGRGHSPPL